ncbi:uncharacterized protein LODBEIA_P26370 [Lodderomyces beijingensis]|uniref:Clustered mitochondria protein homolog n=1 Tax=Lodderomyces beijingensis TaxID=1775926 RepID=A0ABP0ZJU0_9ASCO
MSSGEQAELEESVGQNLPKNLLLKVNLPSFVNAEAALEISSHYEETVTDLRQALAVVPKTRGLTCYDVFFKGHNLEKMGEMITFGQVIEELQLGEQTELCIEVCLKPYNLAAAYEQIIRFREIIGLHYIDKVAEDLGASAGVTKFNAIKLKPVRAPLDDDSENENRNENPVEELSKDELAQISEISNELELTCSPSGNFANATKYDNIHANVKVPIKSIAVSQWSPVPPFRRTKGDLLYLTIQTLENETFNITCHTSGFFVNRSSTINFNPSIKTNDKGKSFKHVLLYELVSMLSASFSKTIEENEVGLSESTEHPETYLLPHNSFLAYPWIINEKSLKNVADFSRSQLPSISYGVDGSDFIKEWNNDIQSMKELPNATFQERLFREKLIQKTLFEFTKSATETAVEIIKGNIVPMNPDEEDDKHIYLKNGVFYSAGTSTVDVFENSGGEEASRYVSSKDLSAIKLANRRELSGISTLVTCIVDFLGKRVVCQAPVPGILDSFAGEAGEDEEVQEKVKYGLSSDGQAILEDSLFEAPLKQIGEVFHLNPHKVKLSEDLESTGALVVSKDTKGLKGTDGRKYVIDLYRTTPRDIEFIEAHFKCGKEEEEEKNNNHNKSYPHGEALVRHEAVNEWWKRKVAVLFKAETEKLEKEGKLKDGEEKKSQIALPIDQVAFNPDAFSSDFESEQDRSEVREISKFIKEKLIPEYLEECQHSLAPFDGSQLTEQLHRQGINMRYLGHLAEAIQLRKADHQASVDKLVAENEELMQKAKEEEEREKEEMKEEMKKQKEKEEEQKENSSKDESANSEEKPVEENGGNEGDEGDEVQSKATYEMVVANFDTLHKLVIQEMVARSVKHLLRKSMASTPTYLAGHVVSHFMNCLFGGEIDKTPVANIDEFEDSLFLLPKDALQFSSLTHEQVLRNIQDEVYKRFRYSLPENWLTKVISLPQLFREIAIKFGIQWKSINYAFTKEEFAKIQAQEQEVEARTKAQQQSKSKKKSEVQTSTTTTTATTTRRSTIFIADDIINFVPIVKDSSYKPSIVDEIFANARAQVLSGDKEIGLAMLAELITIYESIFGKVNAETAKFYSLIAKVYQDIGQFEEAAILGRKAVVLCERSLGFDSHETITAYMNLAYFEAGANSVVNSLRLYKHAVDLWSLTYGKDHPALINMLINASESLFVSKDFATALKFLKEALTLSTNLDGQLSEITGFIHFRIANVLVSADQVEQSKEHFEAAYNIFSKLMGPKDPMSVQAGKYVSNVAMYIEYNSVEKKKKKLLAQKSANGQSKKKNGSNANGLHEHKNGKQKKEKSPTSNPEIANKSVEEILKFIEGKETKKKRSKI